MAILSADLHRMTVSELDVEVVRRPIKNLRIGVYPPNGRVRVTAPLAVSNEAVRLAVTGKLAWIRKHQARFEAQLLQLQIERAKGESLYFLGRRYRLRVVEHDGPGRVVLSGESDIDLLVRAGTGDDQRDLVLQRWYREQLRELVPPLIEQWELALGVQVAKWGIKRMKTRWGSCNPRAHRIWLNLELAKKPPRCLEYIVVHEMMHLLERSHNGRFTALMDGNLPSWRLHRAELNAAPPFQGA